MEDNIKDAEKLEISQESLNEVAKMLNISNKNEEAMKKLKDMIQTSINIKAEREKAIESFKANPSFFNALIAYSYDTLKDIKYILSPSRIISAKKSVISNAILETSPIQSFMQIKVTRENALSFYKDIYKKAKNDLDPQRIEEVVSYWIIGGEDDLIRILEKNGFDFTISWPRITNVIREDVKKLLMRSKRSFMMALYQGSVFYYTLILDIIIKSKLKTRRFKSIIREKIGINTQKQLNDATLGQLLSDDEINTKLFRNYDRELKQNSVVVRNLNAHNIRSTVGPDVTSELKMIKKLIESIK